MFDAFKNMGQMAQLMSKATKLQEQMKQMQEQLASKRISADAGGGRVTATVNGRMELLEVRIDRDRIDASNTELLQELIVSAVRGAQYRAAETVKKEMERISGELGIPPEMLPQQP